MTSLVRSFIYMTGLEFILTGFLCT